MGLLSFLKKLLSPLPPHLALGKKGEKIASSFLKKNNYKILAKNWSHGPYELDIIAYQYPSLVFVEVKSYQNHHPSSGLYKVHSKKKSNLALAAKAYLKSSPTHYPHFRFDIIEVNLCKNKNFTIHHYQNIHLF